MRKGIFQLNFLKNYVFSHELLASLSCEIYSGLFRHKISKNLLIIGIVIMGFTTSSYAQDIAKNALGIRGDFCIYFEDSSGNIVDISKYTGGNEQYGIGNPKVKLGATINCGPLTTP